MVQLIYRPTNPKPSSLFFPILPHPYLNRRNNHISSFVYLQVTSSTIFKLSHCSIMAAPTNSEIKRLLESEYRSHLSEADLQRGEETIFQFGNLERLFTDDINISIVGSGFPLSGKFHGLSDFNSHLGTKSMPPLKSVIDVTKPIHGSVVQVIGGQADEWRAVVLHSTATGKNSKLLTLIIPFWKKSHSHMTDVSLQISHGTTKWWSSCASMEGAKFQS